MLEQSKKHNGCLRMPFACDLARLVDENEYVLFTACTVNTPVAFKVQNIHKTVQHLWMAVQDGEGFLKTKFNVSIYNVHPKIS